MSGTINFVCGYDRKITHIIHTDNLTDLAVFVDTLQGYTTAKIDKITATQRQHIEATEPGGEIATVDLYAVIKMRDQDSGDLLAVLIPAPIEGMFEPQTERGYRVKQADGENITAAYAELSGKTLEFDQGWLCGKGP